MEKMDSDSARGFAPYPGDASGGGAIHQSSVDAADVDRTGQRRVLEHAKVPVIVDAGVGTASDAAIALEMGCHGVLMNTAIASAKDPILMAEAMRLGVEAGRKAYLAGRIPRKLYATASSPLDGLLN